LANELGLFPAQLAELPVYVREGARQVRGVDEVVGVFQQVLEIVARGAHLRHGLAKMVRHAVEGIRQTAHLVLLHGVHQQGRVELTAAQRLHAHGEHPEIGPRLRQARFGTLAWNFRGQAGTQFGAATPLGPAVIVADFQRLLAHVRPSRPVFVGLSIGGLFAVQAYLAGASASGLVLVNTLRVPGPRLEWINRATVALASLGGPRLVMAAYLPLLVHPEFLEARRAEVWSGGPFQPLDPGDGVMRLLGESGQAEWDVPWERLTVPVLIVTGAHDRVFYVTGDVARLSERIPHRREVVFPDAGHLIPVERPGRFAELLLEFARTLSA
jgi:3-oxoadipate enol-lactonase